MKATGLCRLGGEASAKWVRPGTRTTAAARSLGHGSTAADWTRRTSRRTSTSHPGTHTASTAAGSVVAGASFHGLVAGVARGGAPHVRIAVYKALWKTIGGGTFGTAAALLAALDDAIHDGVDVLSLSIGGFTEYSFGALHAVQKGITVVYSGGNDGPRPQTVGNNASWVITIAASKIDRSFPTVITLGNKQQIVVWDTNNKL